MSNSLKRDQDISLSASSPQSSSRSFSAQQRQFIQQLLALLQPSAAIAPIDLSPAQLLDLTVDGLVAGDFQTRWEVAKLLPQLVTTAVLSPPEAIAALLSLLEDEDTDEELAWFLVRILGELEHTEVIQALVQILQQTENDELKAMTVAALANQGTPAIAALSALLHEDATRLLAVRSLSQIRHSETVTPLLQVVSDVNPAVRAAAIEALSSFHDPRVPSVLLSALGDVAAAVRLQAVIGLGLRADLADKLDLVQRLRSHLWDFSLEVCQHTATTLGRLGTAAAAAALFEVLCSPHTPVLLQVEAIRALGWIGTDQALDYLQQRLTVEHSALTVEETVVQEIAAALGRVEAASSKSKAAQILMDSLQSHPLVLQHSKLKQTAALSLGQLKQLHALEALISLLADPDPAVQFHAIAALKQLDATIAHQRLQTLARQDQLTPNLKQGLAIALTEWETQVAF